MCRWENGYYPHTGNDTNCDQHVVYCGSSGHSYLSVGGDYVMHPSCYLFGYRHMFIFAKLLLQMLRVLNGETYSEAVYTDKPHAATVMPCEQGACAAL